MSLMRQCLKHWLINGGTAEVINGGNAGTLGCNSIIKYICNTVCPVIFRTDENLENPNCSRPATSTQH